MNPIDRRHILVHGAFKLVPTMLISAYLWYLYASSVAVLQADVGGDIAVFVAGMGAAFLLYAAQVRFSITFVMLIALLSAAFWGISHLPSGEFDTYYQSIAFYRYSSFFIAGWLVGFGFARFRFFPWIAALGVFLFGVRLLVEDVLGLQSKAGAVMVRWAAETVLPESGLMTQLFTAIYAVFVPVLFYSIFIVAISEILHKMATIDRRRIAYLLRRSLIFLALFLIVLLAPILYVIFFGMPQALGQQLQEAAGQSTDFLKKTYNQQTRQPEFDLQDYAQLLPEVQLSDETVFCTYIDNFFPTGDGGRIPLPVHMRRYVLSRYEPQNEKFVLDPYPPSAIPNDLFSPSVKDVPVGFTIADTAIESSTAEYANRRDISATVYNVSLAPDAFVSPNTGYFYQKLPVPKEDRETFTSVYQCSSLISIWNLPPFVYSSTDPQLAEYREQRAGALRTVGSYDGLDSTFLSYYTQVDTTDTLIMQLSRELTAGATNPYDKVDAVMEHFLGLDEDGNPRFTYTLEPGAPRDARQSFMHYFLFENRRGYCTYFAGATTLLLRAAGIPTRMAVGYAIFDRSNKNSGWYWVYADQGHAWVEVYFPGYGWIDFDTTPTDDNEGATPPKPDATPPQIVQEPVMAVLGQITGITPDSGAVTVKPYAIRYRQTKYEIADNDAQELVIKPEGGRVTVDDEAVRIADLDLGRTMVLSAYSTDYKMQQVRPYRGRPAFMAWAKREFPDPVPVDEAKIVYQEEPQSEGMIFAVDGRVESLLADSSGLTVIPEVIFYRNKRYPIDPKYTWPIAIRPEKPIIDVEGAPRPLAELDFGDTLTVTARSSHPSLHVIKPYLATEAFDGWFQNSFPSVIPVDAVRLIVEKPPLAHRIFRWVLILLLAGALVLMLLATLTWAFYRWRAGAAREDRRLYWLYQLHLMTLNQLGFARMIDTPREYAEGTIDPRFEAQFGTFMNIYLKAKYAPGGLSAAEREFVTRYPALFRRQVLGRYSRWEVMKHFLNFVRTLRFLSAR